MVWGRSVVLGLQVGLAGERGERGYGKREDALLSGQARLHKRSAAAGWRAPHHPLPPPNPCAPQPLVPSRQQEDDLGLPRPLLRWRDAEPLLEDDPRFAHMPDSAR